uniref:Putative lipocalin-3 1 n=1 Tax=Amblyomma cajennense TaxID=34607 RepID=A0A023FR65_AMBCJ
MALNLKLQLVVVALLVALARSSAQDDSSNSEQRRTIDISEFLSTVNETPVVVFGVSISPQSPQPCKVDIVSHTNKTGTTFDRYTPGASRVRQHRARMSMIKAHIQGQFIRTGGQGETKLDTMELSSESTPYGEEKILYQSENDTCAIFRARLLYGRDKGSYVDFRVKATAITDESARKCWDNIEEVVRSMNLPNTDLKFPAEAIAGCQAQCNQHVTCKALSTANP